MPALIDKLLGSHYLIAALIGVFLVKTLVVVAIATDLMLIYQRKRGSIKATICNIRIQSIMWFLLAQIAVYMFFGAIACVSYQLTVAVREATSADPYIALLSLFAVLYPFYYMCLSVASLVAVFPRASVQKVEDAMYLLRYPRVWKLYLFYILRLGLEGVLVIVVPLVALTTLKSPTIAAISIAAGLLVPFALIRGASYELKLLLFENYQPVRRIFAAHYRDNDSKGIRLHEGATTATHAATE